MGKEITPCQVIRPAGKAWLKYGNNHGDEAYDISQNYVEKTGKTG